MIRVFLAVLCVFSFQLFAEVARNDNSHVKEILILIHSRTGNTLTFAETLQTSLQNNGTVHAVIKRVPVTGEAPVLDRIAALPIANLDELVAYDNIIFGSPIYFHAPAAEMMAFLQQAMDLWRKQSLKDKRVALFFSSRNGQSFAEDSLRATLSALYMDPRWDLSCAAYKNDAFRWGACLLQNLNEQNTSSIVLPPVPQPVGLYQPFKISGNQVFINQIALNNGIIEYPGIIGDTVSEEQAIISTKYTMLNILAVLNQAVGGDLSRIKQAVQLSGYFNAIPGFKTHSKILDEASKLVVEFLGEEKGKHTRGAFGVASLPAMSPVEIQAIFELEKFSF